MRSRTLGALVVALLLASTVRFAGAADAPKRKPLSPEERSAILTLIKAVDHAQEADAMGDELGWQHHVLKAPHTTAYVPVPDRFWRAG